MFLVDRRTCTGCWNTTLDVEDNRDRSVCISKKGLAVVGVGFWLVYVVLGGVAIKHESSVWKRNVNSVIAISDVSLAKTKIISSSS